jgi:dihydrofolate reductase
VRKLVYRVAASLDGFIAGPNGEYDWVIQDPSIDFGEIFRGFDALLMGRHTYEFMLREGRSPAEFGMKTYVASTTLDPARHAGVTVIATDAARAVEEVKHRPGKSIWLFGGGSMFRGMLDAGLVDEVAVSVIPVLLGEGIPLIPAGRRRSLRFKDSRTFPSGIVSLSYEVGAEVKI